MLPDIRRAGDGKISLAEFEANMKPRTREKIEFLLNAGWKFDAKMWKDSQARHNKVELRTQWEPSTSPASHWG